MIEATATLPGAVPGLRSAKPQVIEPINLGALGSPLRAALLVALGTACSMAMVPSNVEFAGALRLPSLILACSLCLVPFLKALDHPNAFLRAEHILVMAPVFWLLLDPIQGGYSLTGMSPVGVQRSFLAIGMFVASVWLAQLGRPWRLPGFIRMSAARRLAPSTIFVIGLFAFLLALCRFAIPSGFSIPRMIDSLGAGRWDAPWTRGQLGGTDAFLDHLSYFGYIVPSLAVILARRVGWRDLRPIILLLLGIVIAAFLAQGGGRRIIGVIFGSAAVVWFLGQESRSWRKLALLALFLAGLLFLLNLMLDYRNIGLGAVLDPQLREEVGAEDAPDEALIRVDDNFIRLTQMTLIFPDLQLYTTWRYPLWVISRPVPRVFWPSKPLNPGFDLPEFLGAQGVSLSSSVIGELIMAGGLFAVALGGYMYGRLAQSLSFLLISKGRSALLVYGVGTLALFAGIRSMIELVLMSYGILAWAALVWVFARREENSPTRWGWQHTLAPHAAKHPGDGSSLADRIQ